MTASEIQQQLREVRVFLLYQEGLGDTQASLPSFRFSGILNLGDQDIANSLDPADYRGTAQQFSTVEHSALAGGAEQPTLLRAQQLQYRWKIIEMAVKPMNLISDNR